MLSTAVVLVLSCIQSYDKKSLTDIIIYSLANLGKCFIGPPAMTGRFVWFIRICLSISLCFCPSLCPSFLHSSVHPSVFQKGKFFWNLRISCLLYFPCGIVCGIFTEKSGLGKNDQKMVENGPKMGFFNF